MRLFLMIFSFCFISYAKAPELFLLKTYKDDMNVTGWVISEKYDGVRAFWNGKNLISRSGKIFSAPKGFIKDFPPFELDGELWSSRGKLEEIVSIVNTKNISSTNALNRWMSLRYMVFEVPNQNGNLFRRMGVLDEYLKKHKNTSIYPVEQHLIHNKNDVKVFYTRLIQANAEGVVIRNPYTDYYTGRTKKAVKYKPFMDAECTVVSMIKGKGKFQDIMGSLLCDFNGKLIKIGSGFTDKERQMIFKVGSLIRFKYYGLSSLGNPKYPVFIDIRNEMQ